MATPSLAMIPSAIADSKVYSVLPNNGDGDFTFNRDSSATRVGQNGLIQTIGFFGNELVVNGDFATDSDWTKGTGTTISGGNANFVNATGVSLFQDIGTQTGTVKVEFTVTNYTSGTLNVYSGANQGIGTVNVSANALGTYIAYVVRTGGNVNIIFGSNDSFTGSIDFVSVKEVLGDQPRLNYDISNGAVQSCPSLLLEPASTNLVTTSETLSDYWGLQGATLIVDNQAVNPTGSLYANKLNTSSTATFRGLTNAETTAYDGKTLNVSVFAKKITNDYIFFYNIGSTSGANGIWFNISNGTLGNIGGAWSNSKIEDYGNGWYRCSATVTFGTNTNYLYLLNSDGNGNTTSTIGSQTYLWGSQIEEQSFATSYIPTNGSSQTRAAETCFNSSLTNYIGQTEGTMFIEFVPQDQSSLQILYQVRSNTGTIGQVDFRLQGGLIRALSNDGGSSQFNINGGSYIAGSKYKVAIRYKLNDSKLYINGVSVGNDTNCSFTGSSLNQLSFAENLNGFIPSAKIYDARLFKEPLTDAQLQTLTTL